ncbi:MAG: tRNA uracil 4-sulfurtransferase ThiI [Erysipelotrichaceae bacterium]
MEKYKAEYIIVRYGELSTKGKNRKDFVSRLIDRIRQRLAKYTFLKIRYDYNRIYIMLNGEDEDKVAADLQQVFGIATFSVAVKCENTIENLCAAAVELMSAEAPTTFKVISRRQVKTYPLLSTAVNEMVGEAIFNATEHKVDVHNPKIKVLVEIQEQDAYLTVKTFQGAGGFPVGIGGKALVMLSGGIDSPVAAYQTMKRGVEIEAIHFAAPPYTSDQARDKVLALAKLLSVHQGRIKVHVVPFTAIQMEIYNKAENTYAITLMRRMMYRIAEKVALENKLLAIISGDSIGQVASQTLYSMQVIQEVVDILVLRPLITHDKLEIIAMAQNIGTYETSILPYEDCCTIFKVLNPVIKPKSRYVGYEEQKVDYEPLMAQAIAGIQTYLVTPFSADDNLF